MKKLIVLLLLTIPLSGCWFIFLPIGPIVHLLRGPRYCVSTSNSVGDRIKMPDGKMGTIEKLHGPETGCTTVQPIMATISKDK